MPFRLTVHSAQAVLRHVDGCHCHSKPLDWKGKEEVVQYTNLRALKRQIGWTIDPRCVVGEPQDVPSRLVFDNGGNRIS